MAIFKITDKIGVYIFFIFYTFFHFSQKYSAQKTYPPATKYEPHNLRNNLQGLLLQSSAIHTMLCKIRRNRSEAILGEYSTEPIEIVENNPTQCICGDTFSRTYRFYLVMFRALFGYERNSR